MDPLRPLASLIRSLRTAAKSRTAQSTRTAGAREAVTHGAANAAPSAPPQAIASRLHARLVTIGEWNPARARELFVECILLNELGEDLSRDPGFAELVQKVSTELGGEPAVSARLDQILRDLVRGQVT